MSEDLVDADGECFFEINDEDSFYQLTVSVESSPDGPASNTIDDMPTAVDNDETDWFNIMDKSLTLQDRPGGLSHPSPKGEHKREEDWFLISNTYTSSATSFQDGYPIPNTSVLDMAILSTRNGNSHRFMTTFSDLTSILARMGVNGPRHLVAGNLDRLGTVIGKGAQFTVFLDGIDNSRVLKRVNPYNAQASLSKPQQTRTYFRTLELEILALCHPPLREHRNIVNLLEWCYDHQTPEILLPVLVMERAKTSLSEFLRDTTAVPENRDINIRHHFCLDIADGLEALHKEGIVHGDVKPDNVLVFSQDNPRVPYLCKLSDFGVCISMESRSSLSFASYRGTPGWIPPEVDVYDKDIHGDFSPELLFRCDGFSYCLVVISILSTGGRLPFRVEGEEDEESPYEKGMGLIWGLEDRALPKPLRSKLLGLCGAMLKLKPQDRADVSHKLLADDSKAYNDWIAAREVVGKQKRRHIDGRKTNETNKGITYWMGVQPMALRQLEQDFQDTKNDMGPQLPSETLFGMAISISSVRTPRFEQRVIEYMSEAAKGSCIPAQAITKRICEAHGVPISTIVDEKVLETWLYNSVSTGSFVAAEDLAELNPALLLEAQTAFHKAGGYNAEASHEISHRFSSLNIGMARLACKGGVESLQDLNGNRILHFAAMFDKPEVIKYLVEELGASIDCQNDRGETPLHKACLAGHHAAVEMLISLGADASITSTSTQFKVSPLHWLFNFEKQHIDNIAQLLVSKGGADIGAIVSGERIGAQEQHMLSVHFPFYWPFGTPLHWAAATRCTTAIDSLLKLGADINSRDSKTDRTAQSALDMAARRADSKIVQYLLSKGASATIVSGQGHNPFHLMGLTYKESNRSFRLWEGLDNWIYGGTYEKYLKKVRECISALCKAGCDLNHRKSGPGSRLGNTPLLDATNGENCVVALALLDAGASATCKSSSRVLPVHLWACAEPKRLAYPQGFPVLFRRLLGCMDDINAKGGFLDETVVHFAAKTPPSLEKAEFDERIRLLVTNDPPADINAFDKQGSNPLLLSISDLHPGEALERSEVLLRYGARIHYNGGDNDFIFILCDNRIMTDGETTYLLRKFLEDYSDAEKLHMVASSKTQVFGTIELSAFFAAIRLGKFECVKYLLELGVDPNRIFSEYRRTSLDWALRSGEQIRRSYLETLTDYFTVGERDAASERGVAFGLRFRDDGTVSGDEGISRETYFGIIKIIAHLVSIGAKQAKDLIEDGYKLTNPDRWDSEFIQVSRGWFTVETQPFYEYWKLSYRLRHS